MLPHFRGRAGVRIYHEELGGHELSGRLPGQTIPHPPTQKNPSRRTPDAQKPRHHLPTAYVRKSWAPPPKKRMLGVLLDFPPFTAQRPLGFPLSQARDTLQVPKPWRLCAACSAGDRSPITYRAAAKNSSCAFRAWRRMSRASIPVPPPLFVALFSFALRGGGRRPCSDSRLPTIKPG